MKKDITKLIEDYAHDYRQIILTHGALVEMLTNFAQELEPKPTQSKDKIIWHIRIKNGVRQLFPSYRQLSEWEIKEVKDKYWQDDPAHLTLAVKPQSKIEPLDTAEESDYGDITYKHIDFSDVVKKVNQLVSALNKLNKQ